MSLRASSMSHDGHQSRSSPVVSPCWSFSVKLLSFLIFFGIGWIVGFVVRWSVHTYYIDPMGHCVTPVPYSFDEELAELVMMRVNFHNLSQFFQNFTKDPHHRVGSDLSAQYALDTINAWKAMHLDKVDMYKVEEKIPVASDVPSEIRIKAVNGTIVWKTTLSKDALVAYSADAIGEGRLIYGNFGRFSDFHNLRRLYAFNFTNTVVMLKTNSQLYHPASAVRNAQAFGAKAVVLFPDPLLYILTNGSKLGTLPGNVSLSHSVKFVPGDPNSLYVTSLMGRDQTVLTRPRIPVVSVCYDDAKVMLTNFVHARNLSQDLWFGLPPVTQDRNFEAAIEVHTGEQKVTLHNVIGVIPGRYEPTRYVIIGSHHDSDHQGASRPGIAHSVLMELVRIFGHMRTHNWKPGRSIIFASWDGEQLGSLGSTAWFYEHSKELASRALLYINLNDLLRGGDNIHVTGSPLLKDIIMKAAELTSCPKDNDDDTYSNEHCVLYEEWVNKTQQQDSSMHLNPMLTNGAALFQSMFGISSLELSLKNQHMAQGDVYPYVDTVMDSKDKFDMFLDMKHAYTATKFLICIILQAVMAAKLSIKASDYGEQVSDGVHRLLRERADILASNKIDIEDLKQAVGHFMVASERFHSTYDPAPSLKLLGHHEYNDQLMELERSFLLPATTLPLIMDGSGSTWQWQITAAPYRHLIYGPSLTNLAQMTFLPRLSASIEVAMAEQSQDSWMAVQKEKLLVVDALQSASCVLDNHLVYTYVEPESGVEQ